MQGEAKRWKDSYADENSKLRIVLEQHLPRARSKVEKLQQELTTKAKELADAQQQRADQVHCFVFALYRHSQFAFQGTGAVNVRDPDMAMC
jgi:hypothetical protein